MGRHLHLTQKKCDCYVYLICLSFLNLIPMFSADMTIIVNSLFICILFLYSFAKKNVSCNHYYLSYIKFR